MKNKRKEKNMIFLKKLINENIVYYIGPKFLGNYGKIDSLSYKNAKYLLGNIKEVLKDDVFVILDKKTNLIAKNVYDNGNGNVFFINSSDKDIWTMYFNRKDSKIIKNYFKTNGKKQYIEIREDLFNIINEYEIKKFFNKYILNKNIYIDGKEYFFDKYKNFRKTFQITEGFGESWDIFTENIKARISIHTITYYQWIEIEIEEEE